MNTEKLQAINCSEKANAKYYAASTQYLTEYMDRIGVKQWRIPRWQSVIWYDGRVRIIPYKLLLEGKDKFVWELAGGFRTCYEYMFSRLDADEIKFTAYSGVQL